MPPTRTLRTDFGKLLVLVALVAGTTALALAHRITGTDATLIFLPILGYIVGNGSLLVRGRAVSPLVADLAKATAERLEELHESGRDRRSSDTPDRRSTKTDELKDGAVDGPPRPLPG